MGAVRSFLTVLSPAPLVVLFLLLVVSPVRGLLSPAEPEVVAAVGTELGARYSGSSYAVTQEQASKRVALQFIANAVASWDHRKL